MSENENESEGSEKVHKPIEVVIRKPDDVFKRWLFFSFGVCIMLIIVSLSYIF